MAADLSPRERFREATAFGSFVLLVGATEGDNGFVSDSAALPTSEPTDAGVIRELLGDNCAVFRYMRHKYTCKTWETGWKGSVRTGAAADTLTELRAVVEAREPRGTARDGEFDDFL